VALGPESDVVDLADELIRLLGMAGARGTIEIQVDRGQAVKVRKHTEYGRNVLRYSRNDFRAGESSPVLNQ
jgi:hypothetical protein